MKRHLHSYEQYRDVWHKYYNDTNFCGVIAVASAAQVAFGKAYRFLQSAGRRTRQGTPMQCIRDALLAFGCDVDMDARSDLIGRTLSVAVRALDKNKTYLVLVRGHILTVDKGHMVDWTDPTRRHKVKWIWEVTRNFDEIVRTSK